MEEQGLGLPGEGEGKPIRGLTDEEVRRRRARGEVNRVSPSTSRPISHILASNIFTLFNAILAGVVALLLAVGQVRDAFLVGGLVAFSVGVSTIQEIRAKRRLDEIALLARIPVRVIRDGAEHTVDQDDVVLGEWVLLARGDTVIADGTVVVSRRLEIDESLLTGESESVAKGVGDRVLSGSFCVAGSGVYVAEQVGQSSYAQRLTSAARMYRNPRTPVQRFLDRVLQAVLVVVVGLSVVQAAFFVARGVSLVEAIRASAVIATLVPQGLLFMSTVAYSLGALRLVQSGALVQQLNAVESLSQVDVLCLDKTGTLTGNRLVLREVIPLANQEQPVERLVGLFAASFPEPNATLRAIAASLPAEACPVARVVPFSSERRWSALTFAAPCPFGTLVLGAPEVLLAHFRGANGLEDAIARLAAAGQRVLLLAQAPTMSPDVDRAESLDVGLRLPTDLRALAVIVLEEEVRAGAGKTLALFAEQGVVVKVISGDNPQTALAIARRVGLPPSARAISGRELAALPPDEQAEAVEVATVFGRVSPRQKQDIIRALRARGHYVAMIGDGVNDALALKEANVGVAMRSGSPAARAVADVVLLDDSFDALPKALNEGRRIVNSMMLLVKLFLIRDAATIELILASGLMGAPFPLLPPHAAVIGFLTVGMPALLVVSWAGPAKPSRQSLGAMAILVLQIGTTAALAITTVYALALFGFEADVVQARTAVVTAALISGVLILIYFWHPLDAPLGVLLSDRRILALSASVLVAYVLALYSGIGQRYLELKPLSLLNWAVILPIVLGWFGALRLVARHRQQV